MNTSSNEIWKAPQSHDGFEQRRHRFREEMRPYFYHCLGITPRSRVLDGGCGTGVFARYLAAGMEEGYVTGFDINKGFIAHGISKLEELSLQDRVTLELADGYNLPYGDGSFDAVTGYTYLGVLSDCEAGLREIIRVCRPGGTVSCVEGSTRIPAVHWHGDYPFEGADELRRLSLLEAGIFSSFVNMTEDYNQDRDWNVFRYPKLFEQCGLGDIRIYPFAHLMCYNDAGRIAEYGKKHALSELRSEMEWIRWRFEEKEEIYKKHGFVRDDCERLIGLMLLKINYMENCFETDRSYEWSGALNLIVTGIKLSV